MNLRAGSIVAAAAGFAATIGILSGSIVTPIAAQATRSVWDGVYSSEQAARGKKLYVDSCSSCHKEGLQGADLAPALKGEDFILRWAGFSMQDPMTKKCVAGMAVVVCMTAAMRLHLEAQGRGGRAGRGGEAADPTVPTEKQWTESAEAQRHVAAAMKLAGTDLVPQAKMFCTATGPLRLALARQAAGLPPVPNTVIEPTRVFDNLYFIGMTSQNAWTITTSAGISLIDTMNSTEEARDVLVPSMKEGGSRPRSRSSSFPTGTQDRLTIPAALPTSRRRTAPRC